MYPTFESYLVFAVMVIMVALFGWIYLGDRQARVRLWLLGWIAVLLHFTAIPLVNASVISQAQRTWISIATLLVAGTFFLLSVSEVFNVPRRRLAFVFAVSLTSLAYLTALIAGVQQRWLFIALLAVSTLFGLFQALQFYGLRSPYLYTLCLLLPYAVRVAWGARSGDFWQGMHFYLFSFFAVTGLTYYRHYRRFSPGVMFTAISFFAWGCIPPFGNALYYAHHVGKYCGAPV